MLVVMSDRLTGHIVNQACRSGRTGDDRRSTTFSMVGLPAMEDKRSNTMDPINALSE